MILRRFTDLPAVWRARAPALAAFLALLRRRRRGGRRLGQGELRGRTRPLHPARFIQINDEGGFPPLDVRSIAQDQQGFLWFGTSAAGLNRYDGRETKVYRHDPAIPAA
jgi:hypothetical protein